MAGPTRATIVSMFSGAAQPLNRLYRCSNDDAARPALPAWAQRFLHQADVQPDQLTALLLWLVLGSGVAGFVSMRVGTAQGGLLTAVVVAVPVIVGRRFAGRRNRRVLAGLGDLVDMVGRSLRGGASLTQALGEAAVEGPTVLADDVRLVIRGINRGQSPARALRDWIQRAPLPEVRIVAAALAVASENESGTTLALHGVSQSLRDRAALTAEIRAQTSQATASMQALVFLPALFVLIDAAGSADGVVFLTSDPRGRLCLGVAAVLNLGGWLWMTRLIQKRMP